MQLYKPGFTRWQIRQKGQKKEEDGHFRLQTGSVSLPPSTAKAPKMLYSSHLSYSVLCIRQLLGLWGRRHWQPQYKDDWKYSPCTKQTLNCTAVWMCHTAQGLCPEISDPIKMISTLNVVKGLEISSATSRESQWIHSNIALGIIPQYLCFLLFVYTTIRHSHS